MNKHLLQGLIIGGVFAAVITWIAASDAIAAGLGLALLASVVFGLAAGLCIGGLIAANFAMRKRLRIATRTPTSSSPATPSGASPKTPPT
jgi:hypothetical protein